MNLHKLTCQNRLAKFLAPTLSKLIPANGINGVRKLSAYLNYLIGQGAGMGWDLDSEVSAAVSKIWRDAPCVFDVGGNLGKWSLLYRKKCSLGNIYLFEPQPGCQNHIETLGISGSQLIRAAVGERKETLQLFSSGKTDGSASLHERGDTPFQAARYDSYEVPVVCLDTFISDAGLEFVDFIKFDIEGHELAALRGLKKTFEQKKIGAFSFEFGSSNLNSRTCFRDFWNLLQADFDVERVAPGGRMIPITSYYEDLEYYRGVSNYIATLKVHPYRPSSS